MDCEIKDGVAIIPESVTYISSGAFKDCGSLTSIVIPEGVIEIGSDAFWGCTSLKSIVIPESVKEIGSQAFQGSESPHTEFSGSWHREVFRTKRPRRQSRMRV